MNELGSGAWWLALVERAARNGAQVLLPLLALASAGQISGVTALNTVVAAALSTVLVVVKTLAGVTAEPGDTVTWQITERAIGAAAGAVAAILPLDLAGVLALDFKTLVTSVLGAVGLALLGNIAAQPSQTDVDLAA